MPEPSQKSHTRRTRSQVHRSSAGSITRHSYFQPVVYFSGMIVLLIAVKLMHAGILSPAIGAFGIVLLAVSKQWKFQPGVILSIVSMFAMVFMLDWHWVDLYFVSILSGEIISKPSLFQEGLTDGFMVFLLVLVYERLLDSIHVHGSRRWFNKKTFVVIFKLLVFFLFFLLSFWLLAFVMQTFGTFTRLPLQDSAMISGGIALLATGIPMIIYFSKSSAYAKRSHRHGHHRRHSRHTEDGQPINSDFQ